MLPFYIFPFRCLNEHRTTVLLAHRLLGVDKCHGLMGVFDVPAHRLYEPIDDIECRPITLEISERFVVTFLLDLILTATVERLEHFPSLAFECGLNGAAKIDHCLALRVHTSRCRFLPAA